MINAVRQNGYALRYASDARKNDREIVINAVRQYSHALEYASDVLQADRGLRLFACSRLFYPVAKYPEASKAILMALAVAAIILTAVCTAGLSLVFGGSIVTASATAAGGLTFFSQSHANQADVDVEDSAGLLSPSA